MACRGIAGAAGFKVRRCRAWARERAAGFNLKFRGEGFRPGDFKFTGDSDTQM